MGKFARKKSKYRQIFAFCLFKRHLENVLELCTIRLKLV